MKKIRRVLSACMALIVAGAAALTGCGGPQTPSGTTSGGDSSEPITLNYWCLGNGVQKDSREVWAEVDKLVQEHLPGVSINWTLIPGSEYKEKWTRAMAAQEQIDIAWTGYAITLQDEVNRGALRPMNDLIEQYGQDIVDTLGQTVMDIHRFPDGETYQVIAWQGLVGGRPGIRLPKELSDMVGENYTEELQQVLQENYASTKAEDKKKAYDKLEEYLKTCYDAGKIGMGYAPGGSGLEAWYLNKGTTTFNSGGGSSENTFYVEIGDDNFEVKNWFASDLMRMNYEKMADWYNKGYIRKDVGSLEKIEVDFKKDGLNGYITSIHNAFTDSIAKEESVKAGFPVEVAVTNPKCEYVLGTATGTSIPKTSKAPEKAMQLINLFYADEGKDAYQTFVYGIKDKHWVDNGDGTVKWLCGDNSQGTPDWDYGNMKWTLGTCMNSLVTQGDTKGYYEELKAQEEGAWVNPLLSFKFDNTKVQTQAAQVETVTKEYVPTLQRGALGSGWEARYNEFLQKLEDAGVNDIMAEYQRQVDEYVKANNCKWTPLPKAK